MSSALIHVFVTLLLAWLVWCDSNDLHQPLDFYQSSLTEHIPNELANLTDGFGLGGSGALIARRGCNAGYCEYNLPHWKLYLLTYDSCVQFVLLCSWKSMPTQWVL